MSSNREIDADRIHPEMTLWQGGIPPRGGALRRAGFEAVVLCAREHQPSGKYFLGVRVFHAPMDDSPAGLTLRERETWEAASRSVADLLRAQTRVLVTCFAGLNRSGIVSARALQHLGIPMPDAIRRVRESRDLALYNPAFEKMLRNAPPPERLLAETSC